MLRAVRQIQLCVCDFDGDLKPSFCKRNAIGNHSGKYENDRSNMKEQFTSRANPTVGLTNRRVDGRTGRTVYNIADFFFQKCEYNKFWIS